MMEPVAREEEHVGELKLSLWAATPEELFAEAARVVARHCGVTAGEPGEWRSVYVEARDRETLLADWLNELVARSEIDGVAYDEIRALQLEGGRLRADIRGKRVAEWRSPVKAATYHGLLLLPEGDGWKAEVLLDV